MTTVTRVDAAHKTAGAEGYAINNVQVTERGVTNLAGAQIKPPPGALAPRMVFRGAAAVDRVRDVLNIGPIGSRDDYLTVTFAGDVVITTGCFTGSLDDFRAELQNKSGRDLEEYQAALALILARHRARIDERAADEIRSNPWA